MFTLVHLKQEVGWQLKKAVIIIYTNPFFIQQEQRLIILLSSKINTASSTQQADAEDLIKGIRNKKNH